MYETASGIYEILGYENKIDLGNREKLLTFVRLK